MPIFLVIGILRTAAAWLFCRGRALTFTSVLLVAAPLVLQLLFVVYPIVAQIAFQAFSYHEFDDCSSWLRADVSIELGTEEHSRAISVAIWQPFCTPLVSPCSLPSYMYSLVLVSWRLPLALSQTSRPSELGHIE